MAVKNLAKVGIVDADSSSPPPAPAVAEKEDPTPAEKLSELKLAETAKDEAAEAAETNNRPDDAADDSTKERGADAAAGDEAATSDDATADTGGEEESAAMEEVAIAPEKAKEEAPTISSGDAKKPPSDDAKEPLSDSDDEEHRELEAMKFMVQALRSKVGEERTKSVSDATLAKFLRWKPDAQRAAERYESHLKWQKSHQGYVVYHEKPLRLSVDSDLLKGVSAGFVVSPDDLFDKQGGRILLVAPKENEPRERRSTTLIQRTIHYVIDRMLEDPRSQKNGVTIILDLSGTEPGGGFDGSLPKLLSLCASAFPVRVKGIHVLNAGFWFSSYNYHWYLSKKLQERIHHWTTELADLSDFVDWEVLKGLNVGNDLGHGTRHKVRKNIARDALGSNAGAAKFDPSEWASRMLLREVNGEASSLGEIKDDKPRRPKSMLGSTPLLPEMELDGQTSGIDGAESQPTSTASQDKEGSHQKGKAGGRQKFHPLLTGNPRCY